MTKVTRTVPPLPAAERGTFMKFSCDAPGERVLYCNGNNVIWRSVAPMVEGKATEKPDDVFCYQGHARKTTCVAISHNSQWVISGDQTGKVRLWGAKGDHVLKNEYTLMAGAITDVAWGDDSKRIMAAGDGNDTKAAALVWDTGSKTGEVKGHTKKVNAIAFRNQRPFRVMTCSEDFTSIFHQGPPFKFLSSNTSHTNFVNWCGFSPDGEWAASAGSDSKVILFNGKDGELVKEFEAPKGITGSLWSGCWSPASNRIATAGGDKKVRVWDRESGKQASEALVGTGALEDMQVGIYWPTATMIISVCLDGRFVIWDVSDSGTLTLKATVDGTNGPLNTLGRDAKTGILVAGSSNGTLAILPPDQSAKKVKVPANSQVKHILCNSAADYGAGEAWISSLDNCLRRVSLTLGTFVGEAIDIKENATGIGWFDEHETKLLVGSSKGTMHCVSDKGIEWSRAGLIKRSPTAFASAKGMKAAFGIDKPDTMVNGIPSEEYNIHVFGIAGVSAADGVMEEAVLQGHKAEVTCLKFSPTGEFLASGDSSKVIKIWCLMDGGKGAGKGGGYSPGEAPVLTAEMELEYNAHAARVTTLAWMPSGQLLSGSLDQNITVWDIDYATKKVKVKAELKGASFKETSCSAAHRGGVGAVVACGDKQFASVGDDGFLLVHEFA